MATRLRVTKSKLENIPVPPKGKVFDYYDTIVTKLLVRVTGSGTKSFYVRRKSAGTDRVYIGPFPEISVEEARNKALEISGALVKGENPHDERKGRKLEPTFGQLLDAYIERYATENCLAVAEMQAVFRRYLTGWFERKVSTIRIYEVQEMISKIGSTRGIVAANHTLTYARAAWNWALKNDVTTISNPWVGARKFKTQARERFIKPDEFERFFTALAKLKNQDVADYIRLSLFTGARQSNVLSMRWEDIDFTLGTWKIPRTKSGDSQIIPLTSSALETLNRRKEKRTSDWVFPGTGHSGHLVEPKKSWSILLKQAGIEDLRMHDLRRTLGSYLAMGNQSLHMIGKILGHKSPTATQIYSRFAHDPVRQAMEKAQADMMALRDAANMKDGKERR